MNEALLQKNESETPTLVREDKEAQNMANRPKKAKRALPLKLFLIMAAFLLIVAAVYGVMARSATTKELQQQANQAFAEEAFSVVKPVRAPAAILLDLPGQAQAYTQAAVFAQTTGYVKKWNFDIGSHVREEDILAEIDTPQVDEQLNQSKATLNQAQAALDLARVTEQRDRDLVERKVIARQDFDNAESDLRQKQSTVYADQSAVLRLQALEDFKVLKAPFEGIVTARNTDIGAMVNAGSGNPLFVLAQNKPLRVYINVPESMAPDVKVGASAELGFDEFPEKSFPGKVVRTAGAIDPTSRTFLTEVDVPNEDGRLLPGAFVQVHLSTGGSRQSLMIPANTLLFRSEETMVGTDNKVEVRKIKIGKDLGTNMEVTQGLSPDDLLIVNPSDSLASGQTVRVRPSQNEKKQSAATPEAKHS